MDESVEDYVLQNFDLLPAEILVRLLESLSEESRANLCRTDRRFSSICRNFNLTTADKLVQEYNPLGQLVPTRGDQADLIRRGFETVYSCVFNEIRKNRGDGDRGRSTNIPKISKLELLEMKFGLDNGTWFDEQHGYDSKDFHVNASILGLPPAKGTIMHLLVHYDYDSSGYTEVGARLFDNLDELISSEWVVEENFAEEEIDDLLRDGIMGDFKRFEVAMP